MQVYETTIKVFLLGNMKQEYALLTVASFIDQIIVTHPRWKKLHNINCYKYYSFSNLSPTEPGGVYKKGRIYRFRVRSLDPEFADFLSDNLPGFRTFLLLGKDSSRKIRVQEHISELYTLTPLIVRAGQNQYWKDVMSFREFEERIRVNLIRKYSNIVDMEIDPDVQLYTKFELINRKPISLPYKGVRLLADKLQITVADQPLAQDIAYMALASGVGELNARGFGYVNVHYS